MRRGFVSAIAFCLCVILSLAASGCGSSDDAAHLADVEDQAGLLSVVMSGNHSCHSLDGVRYSPLASSIYPNFTALIERVEERSQVRSNYIVSCYSLQGGLFVANSDDPHQVEEIDDTALADYIQRFRETHAHREMLWIGHSYGGWLAMKTLLAMQDTTAPLARSALYTIDPISKRNCRVTSPMGCSSAPTDISESEYLRLGNRVEKWVNFFQRKTPIVRSSAVKGAQSNIEVDASHMRIDNHPTVWQQVADGLSWFQAPN